MHRLWSFLHSRLLPLFFAGVCSSVSFAGPLVLLSTDSSESRAISQIVEGIESIDSTTRTRVVESVDLGVLDSDIDSIIVLGKDLLSKSPNPSTDLPIVGGAYTGNIDPGISIPTLALEIQPSILFREIQKTGFPLKKVWTVTSPEHNAALIADAQTDAAEIGLELVVLNAQGRRSIARAWFDVLQDINPNTDAIWISDATLLEDSGSYKYIVETAWKREVMVVSHLPRYSQRGIAIGFIPDLRLYGEKLLSLANDSTSVTSRRGWLSTDVVQRVLNQRTLEHIGMQLPTDIDQLGKDDLVLK